MCSYVSTGELLNKHNQVSNEKPGSCDSSGQKACISTCKAFLTLIEEAEYMPTGLANKNLYICGC